MPENITVHKKISAGSTKKCMKVGELLIIVIAHSINNRYHFKQKSNISSEHVIMYKIPQRSQTFFFSHDIYTEQSEVM